MATWRIWLAAYVVPLCLCGLGAWSAGDLGGWSHLVIAGILAAAVGALPLSIHHAQQRRRARSYARLVARAR